MFRRWLINFLEIGKKVILGSLAFWSFVSVYYSVHSILLDYCIKAFQFFNFIKFKLVYILNKKVKEISENHGTKEHQSK